MADNRQEYEIAELLAKAFTGLLSSEEEERLAVWQQENPELYALIMQAENKKQRDELIGGISVDKAWEKVKQGAQILPVKRRLLRNWTAVAACVLLCLTVGSLLFWIGESMRKTDVLQFAGIEVGSSKAVLITSQGQQIMLEDSTVKKISIEGGIVATNDGKKVMYTTDNATSDIEGKTQYNTIKVPKGGEYELMLSDYTKVRLNSDTELRFPVRFDKNCREVYLQGEAYFSVTKDEKRPFMVRVGKQVSVEVLGTEFNVMAYIDDDCIEATLNRGRVRVSDTRITVDLVPDQQAVYNKSQGRLSTREVDANKYSAWKDGKFIFENASLESIMTRLSRWYNIHVFYQNAEAKDFHFTGDLERYEHFGETLEMLEKATNVHFQINKDNVIVSVR